jgi:hypothetical protein
MSRHRRKVIALAACLALVALLVATARKTPPGKIKPLEITLSGATDPSRARAIECIVRNSNDRAIWFVPAQPQFKSAGEWPQGLVMLPVKFTELRPGQVARFTVACPTNAGAWRVPVFWVLKPPRKEWVREMVRRNVEAVQDGTAPPGIRIGWGFTEAWTNYSPEIARPAAYDP